MGLDIDVLEFAEDVESFHVPYSWFHRLRVAIAKAAGLDLNRMPGYERADGTAWSAVPEAARGLVPLLDHPDNEGGLRAYQCEEVAKALAPLIPTIAEDCREAAESLLATLKAGAERAGVHFH